MNLSVNIKVRQTLWSKVLFKTSLFLGKYKLLSANQVVEIVNWSLPRGAYKISVNNGKWRNLKFNEKIRLDNQRT